MKYICSASSLRSTTEKNTKHTTCLLFFKCFLICQILGLGTRLNNIRQSSAEYFTIVTKNMVSLPGTMQWIRSSRYRLWHCCGSAPIVTLLWWCTVCDIVVMVCRGQILLLNYITEYYSVKNWPRSTPIHYFLHWTYL